MRGWWRGEDGDGWAHPNNPLREGCHNFSSTEGLPAAWALSPSENIHGLAGVTIALREADFQLDQTNVLLWELCFKLRRRIEDRGCEQRLVRGGPSEHVPVKRSLSAVLLL